LVLNVCNPGLPSDHCLSDF